MNISQPFIERPVMTTLIMLAIVCAGLACYFRLPVSNLPDVNYPTINVQVSYPGANPETMANNVALPLEKEFMTIPGVSNITSQNLLGSSAIAIQFDIDKNIDSAAQDVEAAIARARTKLPPDLPNDPTYKKVNPSSTPILYIALSSETLTKWELYTYANTFIGQRISMVEGVAQVFVYGSPYAVRVQVDPERLAALDITLRDVADALGDGNVMLPSGIIDGAVQSSTITVLGQLTQAEHYDPLIVTYRNGAPVRIRDLGESVDGLQNDKINIRHITQEFNRQAVVLAIQRQPGANTIEVVSAIEALLPKMMAQLPDSVELEIVFDRSESIRESVADVKLTLLIAFILVVIVIFIYLGNWVETLVPSLVLPMSLFATFIFMSWFNYTIDNLSLLALTLAIGFIVDDAIVMIENIVRRIENGESPFKAALEGSQQICFTILSITISLIAVFIPIMFMGGLLGKIFREFAVTLTVITAVSGVITLTLTPMLCSRFLSKRDVGTKNSYIMEFSKRLNQFLLNWYSPKLLWMLSHGKTALLLLLLSLLASGFFIHKMQSDFIPDDDIGAIIAYYQADQGTSSERMYSYQDQMIKVLHTHPAISSIISIACQPQLKDGLAFIRLKPIRERAPIGKVIQELYRQLGSIPGINVFLKNVPLIDLSIGAQTKGAYQYSLQGLNTKSLYSSADRLYNEMRQSPFFQGVSTDLEIKSQELKVKILRDQASSYSITARIIEDAFALAYSGNRVSRIATPEDQYDVILEVAPRFKRDAALASRIYLNSKEGKKVVPLNNVVTFEEGIGPSSINHIAQFPAVTLSFNVAPGVPLGTALEALRSLSDRFLDNGVSGSMQGAAETFEESMRSTGPLLLIAVFSIYIVLGILYESFIHPITILSTLPPATLGGLLTLWFFQMPLSLYAYMGFLLLIGIVKKNGIIMIDYAIEHQEIDRQTTPAQAIYEACRIRFRPIMMTTVSTVMGAIPIAMGIGASGASRRPLGLVIIGGLAFSQMITLFITPVVYLYMEKFQGRFQRQE